MAVYHTGFGKEKKKKRNYKDIVSSLRVVSVPLFVFLTVLSLQLSYCETYTSCLPFSASILTMCCSPLYFHFHIFLHRKHFSFEAIYLTLILSLLTFFFLWERLLLSKLLKCTLLWDGVNFFSMEIIRVVWGKNRCKKLLRCDGDYVSYSFLSVAYRCTLKAWPYIRK